MELGVGVFDRDPATIFFDSDSSNRTLSRFSERTRRQLAASSLLSDNLGSAILEPPALPESDDHGTEAVSHIWVSGNPRSHRALERRSVSRSRYTLAVLRPLSLRTCRYRDHVPKDNYPPIPMQIPPEVRRPSRTRPDAEAELSKSAAPQPQTTVAVYSIETLVAATAFVAAGVQSSSGNNFRSNSFISLSCGGVVDAKPSCRNPHVVLNCRD